VRAICLRARAVLIACILLAGVLRGGAKYFVCPMMDAAFEVPCCGEQRADDRLAASVRPPDCCKAKRLGTVPQASLPAALDVAESPCVAVLPRLHGLMAADPPRTARRFSLQARAGPPTANERRADLMIWNS